MNFTFTWIMDKLGYMPKIDMEIGKVVEPWSFPAPAAKKKPTVQKATTRTKKPVAKAAVKTTRAKKAK